MPRRKPRNAAVASKEGAQGVLAANGVQCIDCRRIVPLEAIWFDPFNGTKHCIEISECWAIRPEDNKEKV